MNQLLNTIIFATSVLLVFGQNFEDLDVDKLKEELSGQFPLPPEFQNITIPKPEEVKKAIKDKCDKASGGEEAYAAVEAAFSNFTECVQPLADFSELEEEIRVAKPTGDLDAVFNKYCRRRSQAIECMNAFTNVVEGCLDDDEKHTKKVAMNIFTNLLNFVCHKDGDQIALFIAEKGPECFTEQKEDITDCFNKTFGGYMKRDIKYNDLPKFVVGEQECADMDALQICLVDVLEGCEESTPANLVESMFKFVRNETPCVNFTSTIPAKRSSVQINQATNVKLSIFSVFIGAWVVLLVKNYLSY